MARDAVNRRIACDGGGCGEDERHGETQDWRTHHHEQHDQQTLNGSDSHRPDLRYSWQTKPPSLRSALKAHDFMCYTH